MYIIQLVNTGENLTANCTLGDVRLVNGTSELEGRVEVCFGNLWGTICHNSWDNRDAGVICKQLFNSSFGTLCVLPTTSSSNLIYFLWYTFRWSCHQRFQFWLWWHSNSCTEHQLRWYWILSNWLLHFQLYHKSLQWFYCCWHCVPW